MFRKALTWMSYHKIIVLQKKSREMRLIRFRGCITTCLSLWRSEVVKLKNGNFLSPYNGNDIHHHSFATQLQTFCIKNRFLINSPAIPVRIRPPIFWMRLLKESARKLPRPKAIIKKPSCGTPNPQRLVIWSRK